ncbi:hypothetical protein GCM10010873_15560 [Cypionkella aquatica]|uniref:Uncharacterized protein n=1 Tax=Cypionkella aquatica TaxID=1756042 RepID=A0AA37WZQ9_9RHOB|nr:hypothetical protein [Cypionkella aquatica]GLS86582.1 hypothetical protein GCM10010873_15560 [Cypionkella aquatica]
MRGGQKEPLYRRVNTRTHGVHHGGGEARWARNTKAAASDESLRGSMHAGQKHGLDYTPLYRFLISKLGQDWDAVRAEAVARLDRAEPIYHLVARSEAEERDVVRLGESSYWSGLRISDANVLEKVAPDLGLDDMVPSCACCTHTFNGARFTQVFAADSEG